MINRKDERPREIFLSLNLSVNINNRKISKRHLWQMKARAIKSSLEIRHVLPRVWLRRSRQSWPRDRWYRALRDKSPAFVCTALRRNERFADSRPLCIDASSRISRVCSKAQPWWNLLPRCGIYYRDANTSGCTKAVVQENEKKNKRKGNKEKEKKKQIIYLLLKIIKVINLESNVCMTSV